MRVSTAFNKMLGIPGAWVRSVGFAPKEVVVGIHLRRRRLHCPCGYTTRWRYDRSVRRWRHLDLGACKLFLEAEVRRVDCPRCGVRTEEVPWARPGARHTRDFEDLCVWLAQRTDKTTVARLLRCSWEAVDRIVGRVVADQVDSTRLEDVYRIGVDEISYRRTHRYLTVVADHDTGGVVWVAEGRATQSFASFFEALGEERCAEVRAVSMDLAPAYRKAAREHCPQAEICADPFHVVRLANEALDHVYQALGRRDPGLRGRAWHRMRAALRKGSERLTDEQGHLLRELRRVRSALFRAWELKEALRDLYRVVHPADAADYFEAWLARASRSRLRPFVLLARRLRAHKEAILAAVRLGLSNSRLEGINAKIRLIQRRGYGYHSPEALKGMIYLCCGGVTVSLPTER